MTQAGGGGERGGEMLKYINDESFSKMCPMKIVAIVATRGISVGLRFFFLNTYKNPYKLEQVNEDRR